MRNMATCRTGSVVICVHTKEPPSDAEWNEFVEIVRTSKDLHKLRNIVFTEGGGPNAAQRKTVADALKGKPGLSAVVSNSAVVRGIVTALSWFNNQVKAFSPDAVQSAYQHLKMSPEEIVQAAAETARLRMKVGASKL